MTDRRRVAIVGGGIAGLTAAYHLDRAIRERSIPIEARLFEAADSLGGVIRTETIDGFLIDSGPDSLFRGKPAAADLAREIGLSTELLDARPQDLPTLIWSRGTLHPLPAGLETLSPSKVLPFLASGLISVRGKIRMAMEPFIPPKKDDEDESVAQFVRRRLGEEAAQKVAGPMLAGIHAGDPEKLSIWSTFARLPEMERRHGSLAAGMRHTRAHTAVSTNARGGRPAGPPFTSFRGGIRRIVEGLVSAIGRVPLETDRDIERIERNGAGWLVVEEGRDPWQADACIIAIPASGATKLLAGAAPEISESLRGIRYASSATVFLGYRVADAGPLPGATGFLIPFIERRSIFGCTFVSNKFEGRAPEGYILIRAFVGGAVDEKAADLPDADMVSMVRSELAELIGLRGEPVLTRVFKWPSANPQYEVGHRRTVSTIDRHLAALPGLFVTGSALRGVGIPDGVSLGKQAAADVLSFLGFAPPGNQ